MTRLNTLGDTNPGDLSGSVSPWPIYPSRQDGLWSGPLEPTSYGSGGRRWGSPTLVHGSWGHGNDLNFVCLATHRRWRKGPSSLLIVNGRKVKTGKVYSCPFPPPETRRESRCGQRGLLREWGTEGQTFLPYPLHTPVPVKDPRDLLVPPSPRSFRRGQLHFSRPLGEKTRRTLGVLRLSLSSVSYFSGSVLCTPVDQDAESLSTELIDTVYISWGFALPNFVIHKTN